MALTTKTEVTFTGIDTFTNLNNLPKNCEYELGILYVNEPKNRNRYPTINEIKHIINTILEKYSNIHLALHVCGNEARRKVIAQEENIKEILKDIKRIQVNGKVKSNEIQQICEIYHNKEIITQHHEQNQELILGVTNSNHNILIDASGGRGISPTQWIIPQTKKRIGFAGGLGEDNILMEYEKIKRLNIEKYNDMTIWLDMENKLRDDNDKFSLDKMTKILSLLLVNDIIETNNDNVDNFK